MTIYKLTLDFYGKIIDSEVLSVGGHDFNHYGANVPINVNEDDSVDIHMNKAEGDFTAISIPEIDQGSLWTKKMIKKNPVLIFPLENGQIAISLFDNIKDGTGCSKAIMRDKENPIIGGSIERD